MGWPPPVNPAWAGILRARRQLTRRCRPRRLGRRTDAASAGDRRIAAARCAVARASRAESDSSSSLVRSYRRPTLALIGRVHMTPPASRRARESDTGADRMPSARQEDDASNRRRGPSLRVRGPPAMHAWASASACPNSDHRDGGRENDRELAARSRCGRRTSARFPGLLEPDHGFDAPRASTPCPHSCLSSVGSDWSPTAAWRRT